MKKKLIGGTFISAIFVIAFFVFFFLNKQMNVSESVSQDEIIGNQNVVSTQSYQFAENENKNFTPFTASFQIFTRGTKRIFTDAKYHNQSESVFIQNPDPSIIHVTQSAITWDDFFKTLPFSLSSECLVTGTKQTFCSNETEKLQFYINDVEQPNALELEILPNDKLKVVFD